jgi:serine protease Do
MHRRLSALAVSLLAAASFTSAFAQTAPAPASNPPAARFPLQELSASFEKLASKVRPCVVQIFSTGYAPITSEDGETTNTQSLLSRQQATGAGVIVSPDGYIVTNSHVISGGRKIQVKLLDSAATLKERRDGRTFEAKVIGMDRDTDLAVLKIERAGLQSLPLGNSNELRQGQLVMAFGNPLGLESTVTLGVVSSTRRQLKPDDTMLYIQTDAPINPGNSGGPLVDVEGRVIGINTLIITQSGGSEGIGFAVPSNVVRNVYHQLQKDGHVHRGQIGIYAQSISPLMARGLGLPRDYGAIVSDVAPDGPADQAGVKIGDIVLSLNGRPVADARQLEEEIFRQPIASKIPFGVIRDGKKVELQIPVIERRDDPQRFADMVTREKNLIPRLGILAIEINKEIAEKLQGLRRDYGIVVAARSAEAPYTGSGLLPGDVIYELNGTPAVTINAFKAALAQLKGGDAAVFLVERDSRLVFIPVELEQPLE